MSITFSTMRSKSMTSLALLVFVGLLISYQLIQQANRMNGVIDENILLHETPSQPAAPHASYSPEVSDSATPNPPASPKEDRIDCEIVDQMKKEKITVVMRTGATESYTKLPLHFLTTLRCFEKGDVLFYSDVADTMAQFEIEDILSKVPEATRSSNPDFEVYQKLQAHKATGQEMSKFPIEWSDEEHPKTWTLDKYKFMHMLEETYYAKPDAKWYVFMETDTYVVWSNVLRYLRSLDPTNPLYIGSAAEVMGKPFAHGGSGFIISRTALQKVFGGKERGWANRWDEVMINECCGDFIVGVALAEADVPLKNIWPMINGEYPATMPFGANHWCQPLLSMHHIPPPEMSNVWRWEQDRGYETPMQIKDVYTKFIEPQLHSARIVRGWDNLADDLIYRQPGATEDFRSPTGWLTDMEKEAHVSGENCELVCKSNRECFQWLWKSGTGIGEKTMSEIQDQRDQQQENTKQGYDEAIRAAVAPTLPKRDEEIDPDLGPSCSLSSTFKLGKYVAGKDNKYAGPGAELWVSGWDVDKIDKWVEEHSCEAQWITF